MIRLLAEFKSEKHRKKVMSILSKRHGGGAKLEEHITRKETEHQNTDTTNIVTTKKRRDAVLMKLSKKAVISKDELQHIINSLNRIEFSNDDNRRFAEEVESKINENSDIKLNESFTRQGLQWLAKPNIQKQLGARERDIVDDFKEFRLEGIQGDVQGNGSQYYKPVYTVIDNSGDEFSYVMTQDGIEIIG